MDRNDRARVIYRAERMERATKAKGCKNGVLGYTGLTVLRALVFKFQASPTPSYDAIKRATGYCLDTIAKALNRLEAAGLLEVKRGRGVRTVQGWRRITNAYAVPRQACLPLGARELKIPIEIKKVARNVPTEGLAGIVLTRDQQAAMLTLPLPLLQTMIGVLRGQRHV